MEDILYIILRVIIAAVVGGILGFERQTKNKPAGYLTLILVTVGACLFAILQNLVVQGNPIADRTRIIAQVVSGVGFLGAGVVIFHGSGTKGVTTAALIWLSAALGLLIGSGDTTNFIIVGIIVLVIYPLILLSRKYVIKFIVLKMPHRLIITYIEGKEKEIIKEIESSKHKYIRKYLLEIKKDNEVITKKEVFLVKLGEIKSLEGLMTSLIHQNYILEVRED